MPTIDAAGKARHAIQMLLAAAVLAEILPNDVQQRALARYTFLYADTYLLWARRHRVELSHASRTERQAHRAKDPLARVDSTLGIGFVRDYLAAKRQPVAGIRADDIDGTAALWGAVNRTGVHHLVDLVVEAHRTLTGEDPIAGLGITEDVASAIRAAFPSPDATHWYIAADTAADLRPYTLPAAQGGQIGRVIAQINDVANHLDVLLRLAPLVTAHLAYDWLVRSALILELDTLLKLTFGPRYREKITLPLLDLCRIGRAHVAAGHLELVRDGIGPDGWEHIRYLRNKVSAHLDDRLPIFEIHRYLILLDYPGIVNLAEHTLDQLDALGATQLDLGLLLFGERRIQSWPTDPNLNAPGRPKTPVLRGAISRLFRTIVSPFVSATASTLGSAVLAGMQSARTPSPRERVKVPERHQTLLTTPPFRFTTESPRLAALFPLAQVTAKA